MISPMKLPRGIPPERIWLPVDGPDSAKKALLRLFALCRKQPVSPFFREMDQV